MRTTALCNSIGYVADERITVRWRNVWLVLKGSAERRLGKPLLLMYLVLAIFGIVVVGLSVLGPHFPNSDDAR